ncbi:MAG: glycosyltransferase family 4 protein [Caulobacterales bacterium]
MLDLVNDVKRPVPQVQGDAKPLNITMIGNFPPRRCGIATFTSDLFGSLRATDLRLKGAVFAMNDGKQEYNYPAEVDLSIDADDPTAYARAAARINASDADVVSVQHEFGIFGGPAGAHLLILLERLKKPVVTTLHTVLTNPNEDQRRVMLRLISLSAKIVVMSEKGRQILMDVYKAPSRKIALIPHGAPDRPFTDSATHKNALGLGGREVLLTFGLLSPNKGIDCMVRALPAIVKERPNALYVVLGATHPHILANEGERYRESLMELARELGVSENLLFLNAYVDTEMLIRYLEACDLYVTPYLNEAQITSGTLAYAVALGKPVISTPYWHAQELLARDRGVLAPFNDSEAFAHACLELLTDEGRRDEIRANAYAAGRDTIWSRCSDRYLQTFAIARAEMQAAAAAPSFSVQGLPKPNLNGVERLSDDCGIMQHSIFCVPDRRHGYCLDDNARALALMARLRSAGGEANMSRAMSYAAFVQHAWNEGAATFRNFMSYERTWLENEGSPDSFGRAMHALGIVSEGALGPELTRWSKTLFLTAFPSAQKLSATRAKTFLMLGLSSFLSANSDRPELRNALQEYCTWLVEKFTSIARPSWRWFEPHLSYDNARLPEALLRAGLLLGDHKAIAVGLESLAWLNAVHAAPDAPFRPVGSETFGGGAFSPPAQFDQQPLEAVAVIDACAAGYAADPTQRWLDESQRALDWFLGGNDLAQPIADAGIGECYDGLGRHGPNLNRGAESVLAFQSALVSMQALARTARRASKDVVAH